MTGEDLRKEVPQEAVVLQEGDVKEGAEITLKETVQVHRVIIDIFPYVKTTKSDSRCKFVEKRVFRHTEVDSRPSKKPKKSGGKGSVGLLNHSKQMGCVFQDF